MFEGVMSLVSSVLRLTMQGYSKVRRERQRERERARQTERERERQRQADRQTDREREIEAICPPFSLVLVNVWNPALQYLFHDRNIPSTTSSWATSSSRTSRRCYVTKPRVLLGVGAMPTG